MKASAAWNISRHLQALWEGFQTLLTGVGAAEASLVVQKLFMTGLQNMLKRVCYRLLCAVHNEA